MASLYTLILTICSLISSRAQTDAPIPITATTRQGVNRYFFSLRFSGIDAEECEDSVVEYYIWQKNEWRAKNNQFVDEGQIVCDWPHDGTDFIEILPISVRIQMTSGINYYLMDLVTTLDVETRFTSNQTICGV